MIEYIYPKTLIKVKLDGKIVGDIRQVSHGWQYFPEGQSQKTGGDVYKYLADCKNSLENA